MKPFPVLAPIGAIRVPWAGIGLSVLVIVAALFLGLLAGTGNLLISVVLVVGAVVALLSFRPWLFAWTILVTVLVVLGTLRLYAPQFQYLRWLVPFASIAIMLAMFILQAFQKQSAAKAPLPSLFWWLVAFFAAGLVPTLLNWSGLVPALLSLKNYFQLWALLVIFSLINFHGHFIRRLIIILLAIAFIQLPFVLHQYFYVVPQRPNIPGLQPDDVIAGTFGADLSGGGNNALLAAYLVMSAGLLISMWQQKVLSGWLAAIGTALLIFPIFLNETKVSFFYIWVMFLVLFRQDIVRNPARFIAGHLVLGTFLLFFLYVYALIARDTGHRVNGILDYLDFVRYTNLEAANPRFGLTRFSALTFWFGEHFPGDALHAFIGHGLGQTQEAGIASGEVYNTLAGRRYPGLHIGVSALSAMLWDIGLVGVTVVSLLFVSAFRLAGRLARDWAGEPSAVALFRALQAAVAVLFITLPHKNLFVFEITEQGLFVLLVGFLIYSARHRPRFTS